MSSKNVTEVMINGKPFTISGYESEEYLQRMAAYINDKLEQRKKSDSFGLNTEIRTYLTYLDMADDYLKTKILSDSLALKNEEYSDKISSFQRAMTDLEMKLDAAGKQIEDYEKQIFQYQKTCKKLEEDLESLLAK